MSEIRTPWVKFFGPKAKGDALAKATAAKVQENNFYLEDTLGALAITPFDVFIADAFTYYAELDFEGKRVSARPEKSDTHKSQQSLVFLLVRTPGGLKPALTTLTKGMCRIVETADTVVTQYKSGELEGRNPAWAEAVAAVRAAEGEPYQAVFHAHISGDQQGKAKYNVGVIHVIASTASDVSQYVAGSSTPEAEAAWDYFIKACDEIKASFTK